jgi:hypothetical protein
VLCQGEPGIGKTRLAEEVVTGARSRGVPAVWGVAVDSAGAPPYWPWRQALRAVGELVDLPAIAAEERLTTDLAGLGPGLCARGAERGGSGEPSRTGSASSTKSRSCCGR